MAFLDQLATGLGGNLFGGVDPQQKQEALRAAILQMGLGLFGAGASGQGFRGVPGALDRGVETFAEAMQMQRQHGIQDQQLDFQRRSQARADEQLELSQERFEMFKEQWDEEKAMRNRREQGETIRREVQLPQIQAFLADAAGEIGEDHPTIRKAQTLLADWDSVSPDQIGAIYDEITLALADADEALSGEDLQAVFSGDYDQMAEIAARTGYSVPALADLYFRKRGMDLGFAQLEGRGDGGGPQGAGLESELNRLMIRIREEALDNYKLVLKLAEAREDPVKAARMPPLSPDMEKLVGMVRTDPLGLKAQFKQAAEDEIKDLVNRYGAAAGRQGAGGEGGADGEGGTGQQKAIAAYNADPEGTIQKIASRAEIEGRSYEEVRSELGDAFPAEGLRRLKEQMEGSAAGRSDAPAEPKVEESPPGLDELVEDALRRDVSASEFQRELFARFANLPPEERRRKVAPLLREFQAARAGRLLRKFVPPIPSGG